MFENVFIFTEVSITSSFLNKTVKYKYCIHNCIQRTQYNINLMR